MVLNRWNSQLPSASKPSRALSIPHSVHLRGNKRGRPHTKPQAAQVKEAGLVDLVEDVLRRVPFDLVKVVQQDLRSDVPLQRGVREGHWGGLRRGPVERAHRRLESGG